MEFLKIPLRLDQGGFEREPAGEAYARYVELFFSSRTHENTLRFGMNLEDQAWISSEKYIRLLVEDFNRFHSGILSLQVEGLDTLARSAVVSLSLRSGNQKHPVRLALSSFTNF